MRAAATALGLVLLAGSAAAQDWPSRCRDEALRGLTAACERAIEAQPSDPELHALLGQAYFARGEYRDGLEILRQAIAASNGAPEYRYRFAGYAALINEYEQAAAELGPALAARPDDARSWALLADCYRFMKDGPRALQASRRAAELGDPAEAYALAGQYASGDGVARDAKLEQSWLERAARSGYVAAMQDLASLYGTGRPGIPRDPAKQRYWEMAARQATD